jgi:hypothetical protein
MVLSNVITNIIHYFTTKYIFDCFRNAHQNDQLFLDVSYLEETPPVGHDLLEKDV